LNIVILSKLAGLCLSLYLVGFFASMEAAFSAVDKLALTNLATKNQCNANNSSGLATTKERLIGTILMGTNFAVVLFTVLGTSLMLDYRPFGVYTVPVASVLIITLLNVFGDLIPKACASRSPLRYALSGTRYLGMIHTMLAPFSYLLVELPKRMVSREEPDCSEDTLREIVEQTEGPDLLPTGEREMIVGVLDSAVTPIREIMVPRVDMVTLNIDDPAQKNLELAVNSGYSRIPCFEGNVDNIVGILYIKDLFACLVSGEIIMDLRSLIRPALFVPNSKRANNMLKELRDKHTHIAIVVDEYGGTAGIVTIEDLIEDIVGEMRDEYDKEEENVSVLASSDHFVILGRTGINDLNDALDTNFASEASTVGGLLIERLGRLPIAGDNLDFPEQGYSFCIDTVARRSIVRVKATRMA